MRELPAIAVRYSCENVFAVAGSSEGDLRDLWEVFANRICVLCVGRAELMKVNLLIKIQISIRPLAFPGKPCVENPGAIAFQAALPPAVGYWTCAIASGSALPVAVS